MFQHKLFKVPEAMDTDTFNAEVRRADCFSCLVLTRCSAFKAFFGLSEEVHQQRPQLFHRQTDKGSRRRR